MERVHKNEKWTLMCPNECRGLSDVYGDEFNELYIKYEKEGLGRKSIEARKIWEAIINSQIETGLPYMLYKDSVNRKSNQKNLGVIKSSNLCTEIMEYSDDKEIAVCNLASVALSKFVDVENKKFDFEKLHEVVQIITENLNKVIDYNFYPLDGMKKSNFKHRPIGIGVQGLADVFAMLRYPFEGKKAKKLNKLIFETIYHAALTKSCELAKLNGPYESYEGSPISKGILQYDMWNKSPTYRWNWNDDLKSKIKQYGVRNSLLVAPMPTASTSQILGNNECFEPFTSNLYLRRTNAGEFVVINKYLIADLIKLDLWNKDMLDKLMYFQGSVQKIPEIPIHIKQLYKTALEIKQKNIIDMAIGRAPYICQSQSMNLFFQNPTYQKLTSAHFYGWKNGLKTGSYYIRSDSASKSQKFTIDPNVEKKLKAIDDEDGCLGCGS